MTHHSIKITPLGGVGEVGALNCMVYEMPHEAFVVDCGSMFPTQDTLGVDLIIPDFTYLRQIRNKLKGLVLTHGHEDHIGATPFFISEFDVPVYATPFTMELIKQKLMEYPPPRKPKLHVFNPGESLKVGHTSIDSVFVNHSIIDASALAIRTSQGTLFHLTDWKIDKSPLYGPTTDLKKMAKIGKEGVLALFSDSTNATRPGSTLSEKEVARKIRKICEKHKGRIIVTLFSSHLDRIQALIHLAQDLGRKLSFVGRSLHENIKSAQKLGSLTYDESLIIDVEDTEDLPDDEVMVLVTGTQGEPRSALTRISHDEFKPFRIAKGDLVLFSSRVIPGNERNIFSVINNLSRLGAQVLYESFHDIHTSGHAHQDELKVAVKNLRPKFFIPVHGEYRMLLRHSQIVQDWGVKEKNVFVIENGQSLTCEKGEMFRTEEIPTGRVFVDGHGIGDVTGLVVRDRRQLSDTGIVICVLMMDRSTGEILRGPDLISRGFIEEADHQPLFERAKQVVFDVLDSLNNAGRKEITEVQEEVRVALRRFFKKELDRKPMVIPVVEEV